MEPLSAVVLSTGAGAAMVYAGRCAQKLAEEEVLRGPRTLPELIRIGVRKSAKVTVFAVQVRRVVVPPQLEGQEFKVCAKYGLKGDTVRCNTGRLTAARQLPTFAGGPAVVQCGTMLLFKSRGSRAPEVRFRLVRPTNRGGATLAKSVGAACPTGHSIRELELPLFVSRSDHPVGTIEVTLEKRTFLAGPLLRSFELMSAEKKHQAFRIRAPLAAKDLAAENPDCKAAWKVPTVVHD
mmetsp:Transcript_40982/g.92357  ORF Transcript_40982/g.92357 Transcript_40982/m.92357 type:complete len:237 (+) Transcript_40982:58-768(+)